MKLGLEKIIGVALLLLRDLCYSVHIQKIMERNVENDGCSADLQLLNSLYLTPFLCWHKMNEAHLLFLGRDE